MKIKGLNAFQIKIIALILMTIDHVGHFFFPDVLILRIIGRLAAPLFLYILVWSFDYTRDKWKMFIRLYICMILLEAIWFIFARIIYSNIEKPNIFSLFVCIYLVLLLATSIKLSVRQKVLIIVSWQISAFTLCHILYSKLPLDYTWVADILTCLLGVIRYAEYGWPFVVLGMIFYYFKNDKKKLCAGFCVFTIIYEVLKMTAPFTRIMWYVSYHMGYESYVYTFLNWIYRFLVAYDYRRTPIVLHGLYLKDIQWFMIFSLPIMLLYNNEKGRGWKWFFYVYYVLHVVLFFYISVFVL